MRSELSPGGHPRGLTSVEPVPTPLTPMAPGRTSVEAQQVL